MTDRDCQDCGPLGPSSLQLPFTATMLVALMVSAFGTTSLRDELPRGWLRRIGFAPRDLSGRGWHRLVTSALVTHGEGVLLRALSMTAICVGATESRWGAKRAAATFWGGHLATLLLLSGTVLSTRSIRGVERVPHLPRDVGPSAGYLACLGLLCARLPRRRRAQAGAAVLAALAASAALPALSEAGTEAKSIADAAHFLAFPIGWLSSGLGAGKSEQAR